MLVKSQHQERPVAVAYGYAATWMVTREAKTDCRGSGLVQPQLCGALHSWDSAPSPEDIVTTKHIMLAGKILCIPVLDHLIVTRNAHRYHSMFERGTLPAVRE